MKLYNVRKYYTTFMDMQVHASSEDEACEIADNMRLDKDQLLSNIVQSDEDKDVTILEPSVYEMKVSLEQNGRDWNVLDMMGESEIRLHYEEI